MKNIEICLESTFRAEKQQVERILSELKNEYSKRDFCIFQATHIKAQKVGETKTYGFAVFELIVD